MPPGADSRPARRGAASRRAARVLTFQDCLRAAVDLDQNRVTLSMDGEQGPAELMLPLGLLPRVVALLLHVIGKTEFARGGDAQALLPEGVAVGGLPGGQVCLRLILPGGAPLSFLLEPALARSLGLGLTRHVDLVMAGATTPVN